MRVPGSNLLNRALTVIARQQITYLKFKNRTTNQVGIYEAVYYPPLCIRGSVQPVPRHLFVQLGLDFQKDYKTFYVPQNIFDVGRDVAGDQFIFEDQIYNCQSKTDWAGIDGWTAILCVRVPPTGVN